MAPAGGTDRRKGIPSSGREITCDRRARTGDGVWDEGRAAGLAAAGIAAGKARPAPWGLDTLATRRGGWGDRKDCAVSA